VFAFVRQLERFVHALGVDTAKLLRGYLREMRRSLELPLKLATSGSGLPMATARVLVDQGNLTTAQEVVDAGTQKVAELLRLAFHVQRNANANSNGGGSGAGGDAPCDAAQVCDKCIADATGLIEMLKADL
jgi:hypothetical protein